MKKYNFLLLLYACAMCNLSFSQQISIDDSFTAQQLIQNNFGLGCVQVSNITSQVNGQVNGINSFGYFDGSGTSFPFQNGIVLSTGRAVSGANTLNNTVLSDGNTSWNTDPDLENALGITGTLNATSIEFDFMSISNQIQFNYIFASEEYNPPSECGFTDSFAFLITESGSGNPYTNIAVVPETSIPVNSTTVHSNLSPYCDASNDTYFEGYNLGNTNYNGNTTVMTATATILPNVMYHIKLVIADQDDWTYDSAVFIEGNSFNATVDLGDDVTTCASSLILNGDVGNATAIYSWYLDGTFLNGEALSTLNVSQSGTYRVLVQIPLGNSFCEIEDSVDISLSSTQTAAPVPDYQICDDSGGDGVETFDLSTKDAEVLASVPPSNYNISYHYSDADAQNNFNPILVPIQNTPNPQTIYVRIEDIDNGCLAYSTFNLIVNPLPNPTTPMDLEVCDDATPDGITQIDLTQKDAEISSGQSNVVVSYHPTPSDADAGTNPLISPYTNTNPSEQLYARVTNLITGCFNTTPLTVNVLNNPVINPGPFYLDACDPDHDGWATFDLNSIIDDVIGGLSDVSVTFHLTQNDADTGTNPISNPTNYANTIINEQTVYVRVEDNTGCATVTPLEIHTNLLLTYTSIINFSLCDFDNDGVQEFDLVGIADVIRNDIPNVVITFYQTESDRDNQINPIDTSQLYTPASAPETLYITLTSPTCSEVGEFDLLLNTVPSFNSIGTTTYCDDDQDGFTDIDLSTFDLEVTYGDPNFNVTYFSSFDDANTFNEPLPTIIRNTDNPQEFFARIGDNTTGCAGITSFEVNVIPVPVTSSPTDVTVCESDPSGNTLIDLTKKISEVVLDTSALNISFHTTFADAETDDNAIADASNHSSGSQTFFIRVENSATDCYTIESFDLTVNTLPDFQTISDYQFCENESDGIGDFLFATKDNEILHGQGGKQVLYFENQSDADDRINIIDKNSPYQNTTAFESQTIFVRVENLSDQTCYGTSSFSIAVGTNPPFNEPGPWPVCDDISNDGKAIFDLNEKVAEITQGINETLDVTFYASQTDAVNLTNPLPLQFQNTVNPQEIFVSISNGTACNSITSFVINVIQAPNVNESEPLQLCDTNNDGIEIFDLTDAEVDILDIRQNNILVEYFETLEDLERQENQIQNTQNYPVTTNQKVFVRVTNTITECYLAIDLDLIVNIPPIINPFGSVKICDNANSYYDLTEVNSLLVNDTSNLTITYYTLANDAQNGSNAISTDYTYQTNNDTIYTRVENNTTGCFTTYTFQLVVNPLPMANQPPNLESCDDDFDGFFAFDLSQQDATVLGGQSANNFSVTYYNSLVLAQNGTNDLGTSYAAVDQEIIYARVENNSTECYSITTFNTIVHPRPIVDIGDQTICLDNLPLIVSADTNDPNDQYLWSTNETGPEIEIPNIGSYWVTVTSMYGCETTEEFNVIESEQATIEFTETVDFSDPNNITITISGIGNYEYILDHGVPQNSNVFENVSLGYHTVTVIDLNGCSETTKEVVVVDAPKFMTPNNDGYFDTWHIVGVETLPGTVVYIYDRFGKLIKQLSWNSKGWDGTFNGALMPATDYWFLADVKKDDIEFKVKGHFALKR